CRQLKRRYVLTFFQKLPPCLVGIEACASSHYWSRELQALGHTVRLMPLPTSSLTSNDIRTMRLTRKRFAKPSPAIDLLDMAELPGRRASRGNQPHGEGGGQEPPRRKGVFGGYGGGRRRAKRH